MAEKRDGIRVKGGIVRVHNYPGGRISLELANLRGEPVIFVDMTNAEARALSVDLAQAINESVKG